MHQIKYSHSFVKSEKQRKEKSLNVLFAKEFVGQGMYHCTEDKTLKYSDTFATEDNFF